MKISFCTTCMNRLFHLQQTLPANLLNSEGCDREFVIMDYNSQDGLRRWAETLKPWIDKGIVKYCRTKIPKYFNAAHAKNIAHNQATGDIVCNLDADNFIMDGFCKYLIGVFQQPNVYYYSTSVDSVGNHGGCGKIAVLKKHFLSVNGYDESQSLGWGWDDVNFRYRVKMFNNLTGVFGNIGWSWVIDHDNVERTRNYQVKDIHQTEELSKQRLMALSVKNEYVVNVGHRWGVAEDLTVGL